jgi:RNA-binding motif X-linked protein 2
LGLRRERGIVGRRDGGIALRNQIQKWTKFRKGTEGTREGEDRKREGENRKRASKQERDSRSDKGRKRVGESGREWERVGESGREWERVGESLPLQRSWTRFPP